MLFGLRSGSEQGGGECEEGECEDAYTRRPPLVRVAADLLGAEQYYGCRL